MSVLTWLVLSVSVVASVASPRVKEELTFTVDAGKSDCFYQDLLDTDMIDIEYQVIDASHGEAEISFQLTEPTGRVLVADYRKSDHSYRGPAAVAGVYRLCFDNTFSTFSTKTVFFDMLVHSTVGGERDFYGDDADDEEMEIDSPGESEKYLMSVRDILESVARVREHVEAARRQQGVHQGHGALDRNMAEYICSSVQRWSMWQICLMLVVGVMQVIFVKSLFDDTRSSKLSQVLYKLLR